MSEEAIVNEQVSENKPEVETPETEATNGETAVEEVEETKEPTLEEQLEAARAEAEDYKDRWMRSQAEFANARKRMEKQRLDTFSLATNEVLMKLLPVLDDFERAMESVPDEIGDDSWFEGMQLVQRKLNTILEHFNVEPIEAVGAPFDPNLHEAISQEPSDEYESGVVIRELQKGYQSGDRVLRPSLVTVAE